MAHKILVNAKGPETRVGIIEEDKLVELYYERESQRGNVGNIFVGRVAKVLPGMQAAFVNLGGELKKAGYLYAGEIFDADRPEKSDPRPINELVKGGELICVQITKDEIGTKGVRLTQMVTLPGRFTVLMPFSPQHGISRRIESSSRRSRLRKIVSEHAPEGVGIIIRTAGGSATDEEIIEDITALANQWKKVDHMRQAAEQPGLIYREPDLSLRLIRDLVRDETKEILVDNSELFGRAKDFCQANLPGTVKKLKFYRAKKPIFEAHNIEGQISSILSREVPLETGGALVIDQGEALTAVDVNTGSYTGSENLEETVTQNNLIAGKEIARQLRLRNIGGIIVLDFVDMGTQENRKKVWDSFHEAMEVDRWRSSIAQMSELGLIEMTRKRTRESLVQQLSEECPTCGGDGRIVSVETAAYALLRDVIYNGGKTKKLAVTAHPDVVSFLQKNEESHLEDLAKEQGLELPLKPDRSLSRAEWKIGKKKFGVLLTQKPAKTSRQKRSSGRKRSSKSSS